MAELAEVVGAPAEEGAGLGAGFAAAGSDRRDPAEAGNDLCNQGVGGGAVAELAGGIGAPARDGAARRAGTPMTVAHCEVGDTGDAHDADRGRRVVGGAVAELAGVVTSPALGSDTDGGTHAVLAAGDAGRARQVRHGHRGTRARGGAVTELAEAVLSPTLHRAVGQQGAVGVEVGRDRRGVGDVAHAHVNLPGVAY